jgi:phage-related protein
MTPNFERKILSIPGRVGLWDFGTEIKEKPIAFPLGIIEMNRMDLQSKLNDFIAFLFDPFGQPREIKIVYDYEPDKYYMAKCSSPITPEDMIRARKFVLPFVANYPYKQFVAQSDEISWDSDIPIMSDITWLYGVNNLEIKAPQTIEVINDGNLVARPKILISGSASSLTLTLNGESFSFGAISQPIEIDAYGYTVKVNDVESITAMTGRLEKLYLLPGSNSIVIDGSSLNITMTIQFRNQYK